MRDVKRFPPTIDLPLATTHSKKLMTQKSRRSEPIFLHTYESMEPLQQISTYVLLLSCIATLIPNKKMANFCLFPLLLCIGIVISKMDCNKLNAKIFSIVLKTAVAAILVARHHPLEARVLQAIIPAVVVFCYGIIVDVPSIYGCPAVTMSQAIFTLVFSTVLFAFYGTLCAR